MEHILPFLPSIEHMGALAYWVLALGSFLESLAFVGLVVPGGAMVFLGGFLCARGVLDFSALFGFAFASSVAGDLTSYYAGRQSPRFLAPDSRLWNSSLYLNTQAFFKTFGPASLVAGRFLGPLRGMTPFVAGFSRMGRVRFSAWTLVAAGSWSLAYPLGGYIFGNALGLVSRWSARAGYAALGVVLILAAWWFLRKFAANMLPALRDAAAVILEDLGRASGLSPAASWMDRRFPWFAAFVRARFSRERYTGLSLTLLTLALAGLAGGFFLLARAVGSGATAKADLMAVRFLEAFRSPGILEFFWRITLAGRWPLAVGIAGFATVLLLARGRRGFVLPLWAAMGLTQLSSALAKIHYARPRPPTAFYEVSSLSFPSGHASAAAALYGFLAISWVLTRKTGRVPAVLLAALAMALMGFSRLVLGVHYPSDVLGGFLVGLFWVTAAGGLAASPAWRRRWETPSRGMGKTRAWLAVGAAGAALFAMGAWYQASRPLPPPPRPVLALHFIQDLGPETLEQSGLTHWVRFLGNAPPRPMNLLVLIPETLTVENAFVRAGWVVTDPMNAKNMTRMIQSSAREEPYCGAPVLPAFWDSRAQDLAVGIRREGEPPLERHVARLWNTGMILDSHTVWAGLVESSPCTTQALAGETGDDPDAERDLAVRSLEQAFAEAEIRFLPLVAGGEARAAVIRLP